MQITDCICNRYKNDVMLVGICGRAGAGKTTITNKIVAELKRRGINSFAYSGDWRFKYDSDGKKRYLSEKWKQGLAEYIVAINQYTWWDFDKISEDISKLTNGEQLYIEKAYNRKTGKKELLINSTFKKGIIFYESNILGGADILQKLDLIILLNTPDRVCFERIIKKDEARRNLAEIAARWIIVTYSENKFYQLLLDKFYAKILSCNSKGVLGEFPELIEITHIPVPIK